MPPFSLLVENFHKDRDESRAPFFDTMFVFQKPHVSFDGSLADFFLGREGIPVTLGDALHLQSVGLVQRHAQVDLTLMMCESCDGALTASFQYNTHLYDSTTIARLALHFSHILRSALASPQLPLSNIAMLDAEQRTKMLNEWNPRPTLFPPERLIHQLVETRAKATP